MRGAVQAEDNHRVSECRQHEPSAVIDFTGGAKLRSNEPAPHYLEHFVIATSNWNCHDTVSWRPVQRPLQSGTVFSLPTSTLLICIHPPSTFLTLLPYFCRFDFLKLI